MKHEGPDRAKAVAHQIAEKPHQRHCGGKGAEGQTRHCRVCTEFLAHIERAPIENGAFRRHHDQADDAGQPDRGAEPESRPRWLGRPWGTLPLAHWCGSARMRGQAKATIAAVSAQADKQRVSQNAKDRDQKPAKGCAEHAAKAPEAMAGRHDCPMLLFLHFHGIGIHGDIHAADQPTEREQHKSCGPDGWCKCENQQAWCCYCRQTPNHLLGAVPWRSPRRQAPWRRASRRQSTESSTPVRFHPAETGREFGDFWCPAADQEAIGEENQRDGRALRVIKVADGDGGRTCVISLVKSI
jgi:hypothetical protein